MSSRLDVRVFALAFVLALPTIVLAGPLATEGGAIAGFSGSVDFAYDELAATVDHAVFAPGDYPDADPSGGSQYVYAYQVFNTSTAAVSHQISQLAIGAAAGVVQMSDVVTAVAFDAAHPMTGGIDPSSMSILISGVKYNFESPELLKTEYSSILLFTSPYPPTWSTATVANSGNADTQNLPTPTPEPATLALFVAGGLAMLRRRRR